jgi:hypothetical protein
MGLCDHLRPNRVEDHIAAQLQQMCVLLHEDGVVPALEEMADQVMPAIEGLGIDAVEVPHAASQIGLWCFQEQMVVVVHQAIGIESPSETRDGLSKDRHPAGPVGCIGHDGLPCIPATGDMIEGAGKFEPQRTCHGRDSIVVYA